MTTSGPDSADGAGGVAPEIAAIDRLAAVEVALKVVRRATGLRVALVTRVTDRVTTVCAALDEAGFGLEPGDTLALTATYCRVVDAAKAPLLINRASADPRFVDHPALVRYGIESYIAVPLCRRDGRPFGTLCALDSVPAALDPDALETLRLLADLIAFELEADERQRCREADEERLRALAAERRAFVDAVAHDLKNPLSAVKAQAQLLRRRLRRTGQLSPKAMEAGLAAVETSTARMTALIDELLDAARLQEGRPLELRPRPTDLVELARVGAEEAQRATLRHTVRVEAADAELAGHWDRSRLERVLGNLLANAVKYSPGGGEVVVRVGRAGAWAALAVADQGVGIPAADLPHIFERFRRGGNVTPRFAGSGLGLAGAKQIVEQHGGTITVASAEGQGSTVTVRLPLADRADRAVRAVGADPTKAV